MEKKSKKSIIIGITGLLLVTLTLLGLTYAYYRTRIFGNEANTSVSVTSQKLEVTYQNESALISATGIVPGYSVVKTFEVANTGNDVASYSIKFDNIENTFQRTEDWTYVLKKGETVVAEGQIVAGIYQIVVAQTSIAVDVVDTYELTITYANLKDVDQSEDMGKSLSLRINIDENTTTWDNAEEGTLLYALKNDELNTVSDPVTTPGKAPSGVTYSESDWTSGTQSVSLSNSYSSVVYDFVYSDSYMFDEESGKYQLVNPKVGKYNEVNLENKYMLDLFGRDKNVIAYNEVYNGGLSSSFSNVIYQITSAPNASSAQSVTVGYNKKTATRVTTSEAVLSSTEDDYGTSYYFRGDVKNNFVTYSGMCWRIVRIQGDGTIKLALADGNYECSSDVEMESYEYVGYNTTNGLSAFIDENSMLSVYNSNGDGTLNDAVYENSNIPNLLNSWAKNKNLDIDQLSNAEWCNDTSYVQKNFFDSNYNMVDETENFSIYLLQYGGYERLMNRVISKPSLKCNNHGLNNSSSIKFISNIGILSADEVVFAGAAFSEAGSYYLMTNTIEAYYYWTLTPRIYKWNDENWEDGGYSYVEMFTVRNGSIASEEAVIPTSGDAAIRPSVVLKSDVTLDSSITGQNGTQSNPYVIAS